MELNDEVKSLSGKIIKALEVSKEGVVTGDTKPVYNENLPEGITPDTVKSISKYNTAFTAAGVHAVGSLAVEAFKKDSKLERVSGSLEMGYKDSLDVSVDRKTETRNNLQKDADGNPTVVTKYGATRYGLNVNSAHNAGQMKAARLAINEAAEAALMKK